ncbi:MAG: ADP-polyphosphate phosphotransferase [Chlorobiaceae bacterium]
MVDYEAFRIREGEKVDLSKHSTLYAPLYTSRKEYRQMLADCVERLRKLQHIHFADSRFAVLLIFQGMDGAGKDSIIKHVMSGINPQGCQVYSFRHPSEEELKHDFLWRTTLRLPERGRIGIFNRSYYEEVLVVRVHPEILLDQGIGDAYSTHGNFWQQRYRSINDLEHHLYHNGTRIIKFFLHLSREEQRKRFLDRIDEPEKNWKFSIADIEERKHWGEYEAAYEACLGATSTSHAPWYAVPADDKANARLMVSHIILELLSSLDLSYPQSSPQRHRELFDIRKRLMDEGDG